MKLYTYFRSSAAFRVRIALNLKGSHMTRRSCTSHAAMMMRVFDECMKLEAFQKAQPSQQPDAE